MLDEDPEGDAPADDDVTPGDMEGSGGRRATPRLREEAGFTPADELDDDLPAPETGLHALGQLGTAVLVVGALVLTLLAVALALGWIFR